MTHYLPYHPGGEKELMRVAGRDGTRLFGTSASTSQVNHIHELNAPPTALTHAWVNADLMLDECLVGFMVSE
ncbi:hypothetical protein FKP32DRAFT_1589753 [Trametes sanguinea]|nr:hypothetical protein FKP32DRAFT_1589753 [Trametes sanguinea]